MAGRQVQGQGGRRERLLTPHDLAGIVTAQQGFVTGPIDYNSLINKPVIPSHLTDLDTVVSGTQLNSLKTKVDGIQAGAQVNVQSDWNAVSGDAFILNKPTLATVAITGSYNDLSSKPTALPPNGPAGGSLTGTYPNPGITFPVTSVFGRTGGVVATANDYAFNQINGLIIPQGYIDGLRMVWNSGTSISVTSGTAYIPSLGNVLQSNAMLTLSGLVLTASTWYHVYLYSNAGTPTIECVTTAPALYNGTAYQKTGDPSRRYIGSVLTNSSGNVFNFIHTEGSGLVNYNESISPPPFQIINTTSTGPTTVSLSGIVPVTSNSVSLVVTNNDGSIILFVGNSAVPLSTGVISFLYQVHSDSILAGLIALPSDLSLQFMFFGSNSGSVVARCNGYFFNR